MSSSSISESAFSKTEEQINQVQNEILQQGKEIEQFLQFHTKSHRAQSPAIRTLETLFNLFKSELSMNLELRRGILREKERLGAVVKEIQQFYASLNRRFEVDVRDFDGIRDLIGNLFDELENSREIQSDLKKSNEKLSQQVKSHSRKLEEVLHDKKEAENNEQYELRQIIEELKQKNKNQERQFQMQLNELKSALANSKQDNETLEREKSSQVEALIQRIGELESKQAQTRNTEMQITICNQTIAGLEQELREAKTLNQQLISRIELFQTAADVMQQQKQETAEEQAKAAEKAMEELKTELQALRQRVNDSENVINLAKQKIDKLRQQRNVTRQQLQDSEREKGALSAQILEHQKSEENYLTQIKSGLKEIKRLKSQLSSINLEYEHVAQENRDLSQQLRGASREVKRLSSDQMHIHDVVHSLKRGIRRTRQAAEGESESPVYSQVDLTVPNWDDDTYTSESSESLRPLMLATMACNRLVKKARAYGRNELTALHHMRRPPSESSAEMGSTMDIQSEIRSLQREIESLQRDIC